MDILIRLIQFILSLSLLIILHEFGHYITARIFKTRVEKFYLFFDAWGKKLFSFKKGDTEYGIGWLPLGGYVKISGMIDESMDKEQLKQPAKPYEFRSKPAWQRLIIMLGGVTVNFILGILIFIMIIYAWGEDYVKPEGVTNGFTVSKIFKPYGFKDGDKILKVNGKEPFNVLNVNKNLFLRNVKTITVKHNNNSIETLNLPKDIGKKMWENGVLFPFNSRIKTVIDSVLPNSPADEAGLTKGDKIIKINNKNINFSDELATEIDSTKVSLTILRKNDTITSQVTPRQLSENSKIHQIGISYSIDNIIDNQHKNYSFVESISRGHILGLDTLKDFINQFKYVFTKKGATEVGGFIAMGKIFPNRWNWKAFWSITALLSIMLGFMNLLPIPALDGGHALFTLIEMISGKKPSDKFLEYAQIVGFVILMTLVLYVNGLDIYKLIRDWLG